MVRKSTVKFLVAIGLVAVLFCSCGFEKNFTISELFNMEYQEYSIVDEPDCWVTKAVFERYEEAGLSIELSQKKRSSTITPLEDLDIRACMNAFKEKLFVKKANKYYGVLVQGDEAYLKNINFCAYYNQDNELIIDAIKFEYTITIKDN